MAHKLKKITGRLNLTQQFMIASRIILVAAAIGLGRWVGLQIEQSVVHRTAETTAFFVDSFDLTQSARTLHFQYPYA